MAADQPAAANSLAAAIVDDPDRPGRRLNPGEGILSEHRIGAAGGLGVDEASGSEQSGVGKAEGKRGRCSHEGSLAAIVAGNYERIAQTCSRGLGGWSPVSLVRCMSVGRP